MKFLNDILKNVNGIFSIKRVMAFVAFVWVIGASTIVFLLSPEQRDEYLVDIIFGFLSFVLLMAGVTEIGKGRGRILNSFFNRKQKSNEQEDDDFRSDRIE